MRKLKIILVLCLTACAGDVPSEAEDPEETETPTTTETQENTEILLPEGIEDIETFEDLQLSSTIRIQDQSHFSAGQLGLVDTKKSAEACNMGNIINSGFRTLDKLSVTTCIIALGSRKLRFDRKYRLEFDITGVSQNPLGLWIKSNKKKDLRIYLCDETSLRHRFLIKHASKKLSKIRGNLKTVGENQSVNWWSYLGFHLSRDRKRLTMKTADIATNGDEKRWAIKMNLRNKKVSLFKATQNGVDQFGTFRDAVSIKFNPQFGMGYYKDFGGQTEDGEPTQPYVVISYFDGEGFVVNGNATRDFSLPRKLLVSRINLAKGLPRKFKPKKFSGLDWDCQGEETIVFTDRDFNKNQYQACQNLLRDPTWNDCGDSTIYQFDPGSNSDEDYLDDSYPDSEDETIESKLDEDLLELEQKDRDLDSDD